MARGYRNTLFLAIAVTLLIVSLGLLLHEPIEPTGAVVSDLVSESMRIGISYESNGTISVPLDANQTLRSLKMYGEWDGKGQVEVTLTAADGEYLVYTAEQTIEDTPEEEAGRSTRRNQDRDRSNQGSRNSGTADEGEESADLIEEELISEPEVVTNESNSAVTNSSDLENESTLLLIGANADVDSNISENASVAPSETLEDIGAPVVDEAREDFEPSLSILSGSSSRRDRPARRQIRPVDIWGAGEETTSLSQGLLGPITLNIYVKNASMSISRLVVVREHEHFEEVEYSYVRSNEGAIPAAVSILENDAWAPATEIPEGTHTVRLSLEHESISEIVVENLQLSANDLRLANRIGLFKVTTDRENPEDLIVAPLATYTRAKILLKNQSKGVCLVQGDSCSNAVVENDYFLGLPALSLKISSNDFAIPNIQLPSNNRLDAQVVQTVREGSDLVVRFKHTSPQNIEVKVKSPDAEVQLSDVRASRNEIVEARIKNYQDKAFAIQLGDSQQRIQFGKFERRRIRDFVKSKSGGEVSKSIRIRDLQVDDNASDITSDDEVLEEGIYDVELNVSQSSIEFIDVKNLTLSQDIDHIVRIDTDIPKDTFGELRDPQDVFAIDPEAANFTYATVTITAKATNLYKCEDYDFDSRDCYGEWFLWKTDLVPGQTYKFNITPDDPAFGQINDPGITVLGESGSIDISNFEDTVVEFRKTYSNPPIVFATPASQNGDTSNDNNALVPVIRNINTTHVTLTICRDSGNAACAGTVNEETLHYFVFDVDATYPSWMAVGTQASVGTTGADTAISFGKTLPANPYVFTQSQTDNQVNNVAAHAWVDTVTQSSAVLVGCAHPGTGDTCQGTSSETFGWLAIDPTNVAFTGATNFQSGTESISNSDWTAITWTANYSDARIMVTQNSDNGGQDPQYSWARDVDTSTPDIRYCEQDAGDVCHSHTAETVRWFTVEDGYIMIGSGDDSLPVINSIADNPDPINESDLIDFTVNATDDASVDSVWVVVNGTTYQLDQESTSPVNEQLESDVNLTLNDGYQSTTNCICPSATGGSCIFDTDTWTSGEFANTTYTSLLPVGTYNLTFYYCPENDGDDDWVTYLEGAQVDSFTTAGGETWVSRTITGLQISPGDEITFSCSRGSASSYCRQDYFVLEAPAGQGLWVGSINTSGLMGLTDYEVFANDTAGNTADSEEGTFVVLTGDVTPPDTVTNLASPIIGEDFIFWNWTNPTNPDYLFSIIRVDGVNVINSTVTEYNATGFAPNTTHTITIQTVDNSLNINTTLIGNTNTTLPPNVSPAVVNVQLFTLTAQNSTYEDLAVSFDASDLENDSIKNVTVWRRNGSSVFLANIPFEGGSNNTFTPDFSTVLGYNLTASATWNPTGGYDGFGAYDFDGVSQFIDLTDGGSSAVFDALISERTVAMWYNATTLTGGYRVLFEEGGTTNGMSIYIDSGSIYAGAWSEGDGWDGNWSSTATTANEWHFVALVFDGPNNIVGMYHDGVWIPSFANSTQVSGHTGDDALGYTPDGTVASPNSGTDIPGNSAFFQGTLDEFMVFDTAVSTGLLDMIYTQGISKSYDSSETSVNDTWQACVTVTDDEDIGNTQCSNVVTILDSATISIEDNNSQAVPVTIEVLGQSGDLINFSVVPNNLTNVQELLIVNHNVSAGQNTLGLELQTNDDFNQTYSIDPESLDFEYINVTITATGNFLHKCVNFSFANQTCNEDVEGYVLVRDDLVPGQNYTITLVGPDPGFGETITGPDNISDSYFRSGASSTNYGAQNRIRVGRSTGANTLRGIIEFNTTTIPQSATVTNAELRLYFNNIPGSGSTGNEPFSVHRVQQSPARPWTELNVTWLDYNASSAWSSAGSDFNATPTDTVTFDNSSLNSFIVWNVTADVQDFVSNPATNFGWIVKHDNESVTNTRRDFRSKNFGTAAQRPVLFVNFSDFTGPNVTNLAADNILYALNESVLVFADVDDDLGVDTVLANITDPFNTSFLQTMTFNNVTGRYRTTFNDTGFLGNYTVQIIANDTSGNVNDFEFTNFLVVEPNVTAIKTDSVDPVQIGSSVEYRINYSVEESGGGIVLLDFEDFEFVTTNAFAEDSPQMLESSDGTLIIAYHASPGANDDIYVVRSENLGANWSSPIQVTDESDDDNFPNIIENSAGDLLIVYVNDESGNQDIRVVQSTDDGLTWTEPFEIVSNAGSDFEPVMEQDSSGMYYVAYAADVGNGSTREILIENSTSFSSGFGSQVTLTNNSYNDYDIEMLVDDDDNFFFAWAPETPDFQEIWFGSLTAPFSEGELDDVKVQITDNDIYDYETSINEDNDGNIYVGWVGLLNTSEVGNSNVDRTTNEIFIATSRDDGASFEIRRITENNVSDAYPGIVQTGSDGLYFISALRPNGGDLDVTFAARLPSPEDAINLTITDTVPDEIIVTSIGQGGQQVGNEITWVFDQVFAGSSGFVSFTGTVNRTTANGTIILNEANLTYEDRNGRFIETIMLNETTLAIDTIPPNATQLLPTPGIYPQGNPITISVNVTDNAIVDTVQANVTIPGDGSEIITLVFNASSGLYEGIWTNTTGTGTYTYTIIANDTTGNVNNTESSTFTVSNSITSTPTDITCNGGTCNASFSSQIELACTGSVDPENDTITYVIEAFFNETRLENVINRNSSFTSSSEGFTYQDDIYGTSSPTQAAGSQLTDANCPTGSCLNVNLNELSPIAGGPFSGGWNGSINISGFPQVVNISFSYKMRFDDDTDQTDQIEIRYRNITSGAQISGPVLEGIAGTDSIDEELTGTVSYLVDLSQGTYFWDVGCFMTTADATNENGECWIDDVVVTGVDTPVNEFRYEVVGNHSEGGSVIWDISVVQAQSGVAFRCRATDDGSSQFSGYYNESGASIVLDILNPEVELITPLPGANVSANTTVEISLNITDASPLSTVFANLTFPNGSSIIVPLNQFEASTIYNATVGPLPLGLYNVTFFANDTSGNLNNTESTFFNVVDLTPPSVTDLGPTPAQTLNQSQPFEIGANVTDNIGVDTVIATLTYPNGSMVNFTLNNSAGARYNLSFISHNEPGQYNITFFANDTSGNINNTEVTTFIVQDLIPPAVTVNTPLENDSVNTQVPIPISINVTDLGEIDTVFANITLPNGSTIILTLVPSVNDTYNASFFVPDLLGQYNVTFFANDTSGNINNTVTTFFVANFVPIVAFTLTLPGQPAVNASVNSTATAVMYFNSSVQTFSDMEPCVLGTSDCQNSTLPFFQYLNTGNVNLSFAIGLDSDLPAQLALQSNSVPVPGTALEVNSTQRIIASSVAPLGTLDQWFYGDFINAYPSDSTSRNLTSNGTQSS